MSKLLAGFRSKQVGQLALIAAIFLLSLATFNILFAASIRIEYFKEVIAALIGVLMAAVITTILLNSQSAGEETKERNVEVFRTKLSIYGEFVNLAVMYLKDAKLSKRELHDLQRVVYRLSLVSSGATTDKAISFIRARSVGDLDCEMLDVLNAFRRELSLENVDDLSHFDMEAVSALVSGQSTLTIVRQAQKTLEDARSKLLDRIEHLNGSMFDENELEPPVGSGNGCGVRFSSDSEIMYELYMDYEGQPDCASCLNGWIDLRELEGRDVGQLRDLVKSLGFAFSKETPNQLDFVLNLSADEGSGVVADEGRVWTVDELADAIVTIERAARASVERQSKRALGE